MGNAPRRDLRDRVAFADLSVMINGDLRQGPATVPVWDRGLLYGDGCFEGLRVRDGRLFRPSDHFDRLNRSARVLDIAVPVSYEEWLSQITAVVDGNGFGDAHIRVLLTRGVGLPGLDPRGASDPCLIIMAYPLPPLLGHDPVSILVSSIVKKAPRSVDAHVKSLNYLDAILAKQQAIAGGATDAVMLDDNGSVSEATGANVFVAAHGIVSTPTTRSALPGITRLSVLELLRKEGVPTEVRDVSWGELYSADEMFLTGTATGIAPVATVDGRALGTAPGPLTQLASSLYATAVGTDEATVRI